MSIPRYVRPKLRYLITYVSIQSPHTPHSDREDADVVARQTAEHKEGPKQWIALQIGSLQQVHAGPAEDPIGGQQLLVLRTG